jgi:hypothetical protein
VAQLEPVGHGRGLTVKEALRRHRPDHGWSDDLARSRDLLHLEDRS